MTRTSRIIGPIASPSHRRVSPSERWRDAPSGPNLFDTNEEIGAPSSDPRVFPVADDDQQSIGQVLQALQNRPARTSYFVAAIFSGVWIVGCLALAVAYLGDVNAALGPNHSPLANLIGLGAAALLPIIFFFGVAHMAWRAQELRLVAQSMAKVAMRLAEPEIVARDSIVTVGQAIRREVAAMGDGVERALARASELETLVRQRGRRARTYLRRQRSPHPRPAPGARPTSATRWSDKRSRSVMPSTTSTSTSPRIFRRSAISSVSRSTKRRNASPSRWLRRANTSRWR